MNSYKNINKDQARLQPVFTAIPSLFLYFLKLSIFFVNIYSMGLATRIVVPNYAAGMGNAGAVSGSQTIVTRRSADDPESLRFQLAKRLSESSASNKNANQPKD